MKEVVADGVHGLKKHGAKDKIDNCTCLICLAPPSTYHERTSLDNAPVFLNKSRVLGCSSMHLKINCCELVFHVAVNKFVSGPLSIYREELLNENSTKAKTKKKMISDKKTSLEKEALTYFQKRFEGPLGQGLRVFVPEPAKGGNSNTGVCTNRFSLFVFKIITHIQFFLTFKGNRRDFASS